MANPTWRELRDKLNTLSQEELDCNVTIFDGNVGEFHPASDISVADADDVLDTGHLFLNF